MQEGCGDDSPGLMDQARSPEPGAHPKKRQGESLPPHATSSANMATFTATTATRHQGVGTAGVSAATTPGGSAEALARALCAFACPCSAALRYHRTASTESSATPSPVARARHRGWTARLRAPARRPCATTAQPPRAPSPHPRRCARARHQDWTAPGRAPARRPCATTARLRAVLRHALALGVHQPRLDWPRLPLLGGLAQPPHRFRAVPIATPRPLRYAPPTLNCSACVPLLAGPEVPPHSLFGVLRHTLAVVVGAPKVELRESVSLLGGLTAPSHSFLGVLRHALADEVGVPNVGL